MFKSFWRNEEGMEFLQLVFIIVITVAIGGAIWLLAESITNKVGGATEQVNNMGMGGSGGAATTTVSPP